MANSRVIDHKINCYEDFKSQVRHIEKYLHGLEGDDLQKSCIFLESTLKPYFEKSKEIYGRLNQDSNIERHLNIDSQHITNFDNEQTFTEKFLSSVQDDAFLPDTLLIQNNILEAKTSSNENCFDKYSSNSSIKLSHPNSVISEDNIKYDISFKDGNTLNTYLDLSHKSALQQTKIEDTAFSSSSENKNLEDNSDIILNLCSKNRSLNLKDNDKDIQNEASNISEEFDSISYINSSNILLEERLLDKNDTVNTNSDVCNFTSKQQSEENECNSENTQTLYRDDITKILVPHFGSNISVIHSTNSLKDDKKSFPIHNDYGSYITEMETDISLNNDTSKPCLENDDQNENQESLISIDCDSNGILNLKKEPTCIEREIYSKNTSSQDSNSLNLGFYAIFNSLESLNKSNTDNNKFDNAENNIKALNLVNKKFKTENLPDQMQNSDCELEKKKSLKDNKLNLLDLGMEEKFKDDLSSLSKDINNGTVSCWKCQTEFADVGKYNDHNYMGSCGNLLYCSHCDIHFNSKTVYNQHLLCHKRNTCTKCSSTFRRRQLLRAHMKSEHGINLVSKTFPCEHCPRVFMKRSSIYYHLQKHALPNQKVCPKCGKFIDGESAFTEHMNEHIKNAFFQCHICSYIFERFQQYNDHMEGHKKHVCTYCEANLISFSSKKMLFKHYKTEHPDLPQKVILNKKYSCDQCAKVFNRPSLLQDHKRTHNETLRYDCRFCNKKYALRSSLRKHLKALHSQNEKRINVCQHCNMAFPTVNLLDKHCSVVHNTIINYSCTYCDYKTRHRKALKRHMDSHIEEKKYLCDICGSMFQCSTTLKDHTLFLHSDERKFKCKECDKSFKNRSCLSRHLRTHSSERPYKCECGSCFKQSYHLIRHLSTAHNKKGPKKAKTRSRGDVDERDIDFYNQNVTISTNADPLLVPEVERSTSDILLPPGNTVLMSESSITQEPSPLFTVLDSQLIQLIPSTLQLHQEGIHTVSLVNGEIHTLSLAPPTYQISQEPFTSSASSDAIIIHSSQTEALSLQDIQTENAAINDGKINCSESMVSNADDHKTNNTQITLEEEHGLQFASNALSELQYRENVDENDSIHSLSTTHYLTHQESSLSHDIATNNISIF